MNDIKIGRMVIGAYGTNVYFVYREDEKKAIVIDPADYGDKIYDALKKNGFTISAVLLTHGHFDHILGHKAFVESAGDSVKTYASILEEETLKDTEINLSLRMKRPTVVSPDVLLRDGEEFSISGIGFLMISTPGHTLGSCCYYIKEAGFLISGDTLFCESVGRTDFPTGNAETLVNNVKEKLFVLPDETLVYPGHGDSTSIGHEKKYNPFCV